MAKKTPKRAKLNQAPQTDVPPSIYPGAPLPPRVIYDDSKLGRKRRKRKIKRRNG